MNRKQRRSAKLAGKPKLGNSLYDAREFADGVTRAMEYAIASYAIARSMFNSALNTGLCFIIDNESLGVLSVYKTMPVDDARELVTNNEDGFDRFISIQKQRGGVVTIGLEGGLVFITLLDSQLKPIGDSNETDHD